MIENVSKIWKISVASQINLTSLCYLSFSSIQCLSYVFKDFKFKVLDGSKASGLAANEAGVSNVEYRLKLNFNWTQSQVISNSVYERSRRPLFPVTPPTFQFLSLNTYLDLRRFLRLRRHIFLLKFYYIWAVLDFEKQVFITAPLFSNIDNQFCIRH